MGEHSSLMIWSLWSKNKLCESLIQKRHGQQEASQANDGNDPIELLQGPDVKRENFDDG